MDMLFWGIVCICHSARLQGPGNLRWMKKRAKIDGVAAADLETETGGDKLGFVSERWRVA